MNLKKAKDGLGLILIAILTIRICSYFTLFPDSIGITRVVKIFLRLAVTGLSALIYFRLGTYITRSAFVVHNKLPFLAYTAYLFLGLISISWSSSMGYSLLQWVMVTESLVFVVIYYRLFLLYYSQREKPIDFASMFAYATGLISLGFLLGLMSNPDLYYRQTHGGEVSRLGGFIINPNELGMLVVLGAGCIFQNFLDRKFGFPRWATLVLCVVVLLLTQSRSSLGAFFIIGIIAVLKSKNIRLQAATVLGGILVIPILLDKIIFKQGNVEEVMSMTGRLPFWKDLIQDGFTREPLFGFGFMRISYNDKFDSIHAYAASMTHNTFVQVLLNLGLVGAFICLVQMIFTFYAIKVDSNKHLRSLSIFMLIPLFINSMTEFGIFGESNYGILFYQFVIFFFVLKLKNE